MIAWAKYVFINTKQQVSMKTTKLLTRTAWNNQSTVFFDSSYISNHTYSYTRQSHCSVSFYAHCTEEVARSPSYLETWTSVFLIFIITGISFLVYSLAWGHFISHHPLLCLLISSVPQRFDEGMGWVELHSLGLISLCRDWIINRCKLTINATDDHCSHKDTSGLPAGCTL